MEKEKTEGDKGDKDEEARGIGKVLSAVKIHGK